MNPPVTVQVMQPSWYEYITIAAIVLGPVFALFAQRALDWFRERERREKQLYFTLMSTRFVFNSIEHVQALNSIDVVFAKDENIRDLWKKCMNHLFTDEGTPGWQDKLATLRTDLYQAIGNKLGFRYTTEYIKNGIYFPTRHVNTLVNQEKVLGGFAKAIENGVLKVKVEVEPAADQNIVNAQRGVLEGFAKAVGNGVLKVKVEPPPAE
jgi:hypothetical protein